MNFDFPVYVLDDTGHWDIIYVILVFADSKVVKAYCTPIYAAARAYVLGFDDAYAGSSSLVMRAVLCESNTPEVMYARAMAINIIEKNGMP